MNIHEPTQLQSVPMRLNFTLGLDCAVHYGYGDKANGEYDFIREQILSHLSLPTVCTPSQSWDVSTTLYKWPTTWFQLYKLLDDRSKRSLKLCATLCLSQKPSCRIALASAIDYIYRTCAFIPRVTACHCNVMTLWHSCWNSLFSRLLMSMRHHLPAR